MKLSQFDLGWYGQWAIQKNALEEWSRPGLTNGLGSLQVSADISSLRHILFPPVSGGEEITAFLTLNGNFLAASLLETEVVWKPWCVERALAVDGWALRSTVAMVPDEQAVVQRLCIRNTSEESRSLDVALRLSGRCVNRGVEKWYWGVPGVATTLAGLLESTGLDPVVERLGNGLLTRERPPEKADAHVGHAWNAQLLSPSPNGWRQNGDAGWVFPSVPAGGEVVIDLAIGMNQTREAVMRSAENALARVEAIFQEAEIWWRTLWKDAFADGGGLSGKLPDLDLPEELLPVAASSVMCLLQARRTHRATEGKAFYNISTPRRVEACYYPNDWGMAARALAQIDPEATWRQFAMALKADIRRFNQINFLTGKGGDAVGEGWPYTVDIYNLFYAGWYLWQEAEEGSLTALTDRSFDTPQGKMNLLEVFEDLAFDWRKRRVDSLGLADYGSKHELLECVSTYEHVVAALNAGAVWMLRRLAEVYRVFNRNEEAAVVDQEADALRQAILQHLYVEGCGWFRCVLPDGRSREVRHCWDTGMVLMCIGQELPEKVQSEIVRFFEEELMTPGWIRALSPHDGDAAVSGLRADHQFNGAFCSWPAEVGLGLVRIGRLDLLEKWFSGIARTARQGPFAQAHYDERVWPATLEGATKVTDEAPQCCHWSNISGGLFFTALQEFAARRKPV